MPALSTFPQMTEQGSELVIREMVDELAERLADNEDDLEGWLKLARARMVLGETDKAKDALRKLSKLFHTSSVAVDRFMPSAETLSMSGFKSRTTLYQLIRENEFPAPYVISKGRRGWSLLEVQAWISERKKKGRTTRLE